MKNTNGITAMNNHKNHNLLKALSFQECAKCEKVLIWNNPVGTFRMLKSDAVVKCGITGQADSIGVFEIEITEKMIGKKVGLFFGAEFKTGAGKLSEVQQNWAKAIKRVGGVVIEVREKEDILQGMQKYIADLEK